MEVQLVEEQCQRLDLVAALLLASPAHLDQARGLYPLVPPNLGAYLSMTDLGFPIPDEEDPCP